MKTINESLKEAGFSDELLNAFNKLDYTDYQDDIIEDTCSDFNGSPIISSTTPQLNEHKQSCSSASAEGKQACIMPSTSRFAEGKAEYPPMHNIEFYISQTNI